MAVISNRIFLHCDIRLYRYNSQIKRAQYALVAKKGAERPGGAGGDDSPDEAVSDQSATVITALSAERMPTQIAESSAFASVAEAAAAEARDDRVDAAQAEGDAEDESGEERGGNDEEAKASRTRRRRNRRRVGGGGGGRG